MAENGSNFDVLTRIYEERRKRGWTEYQLAKNAGMRQSTISSWYGQNLTPSLPSLEKICDAFGITLAAFFSEPDGAGTGLTVHQQSLLEKYAALNPSQRSAVDHLISVMLE